MSKSSSPSGFIERQFKVKELGSTIPREIIAGVTTFAAMAYILVVNPDILSVAGMPKEALITTTAISAAIGTLLMAFMANYPLALAPGMGINAFFAFGVCLGMNVPWQSALPLVFINGILFIILSVSGIREAIVNALPNSLKAAVCAGVGLFICFIGLKNGGIVTDHPATLVTMGDFTSPPVALFGIGILLTCVLVARGTPAAIIISMGVITFIGLFVSNGQTGELAGKVTELPTAIFSMPASIEPIFMKLDFSFLINEPLKAIPVIITLLLVDLFDGIGTLIGVAKRAGLMTPEGKVPRVGKALTADAIATTISPLLGTSTVTSYIESATGVQAGARTGLASVATAVLFLLALFLTPIILMIPAVAVAPALVVVGLLMFESVSEIDLKKFDVAAPAIITLIAMPLTFSISNGMGFGLITLVAISLGMAIGRPKKSSAMGEFHREYTEGEKPHTTPALGAFTYILAGIFALHFVEKFLFKMFE
ncbi:NCS2 family permease [Phragmitibacter flavus]|uniref:NCS2 family permease n=1 Tax=Phragmitibacter flavus TaxID=2576071 RepID=A0A5R8KIM2_9BACT|nr:NCS2 family permease [Phragmitibacter flavus]TLD72163.1 NCS2 family permease [Phragmitibacter flavus]